MDINLSHPSINTSYWNSLFMEVDMYPNLTIEYQEIEDGEISFSFTLEANHDENDASSHSIGILETQKRFSEFLLLMIKDIKQNET